MLLTYIFPNTMSATQSFILDAVIIAAGTALLVGVVNLFTVHLGKLRGGGGNPLYSLILIASLLLTFTVTLLPGFVDTESDLPQWILENIQVPVETSLMAVMAVTLTYASTRMLARRTDLYTIVFILFVLSTMLASAPFFGFLEFSGETTRILASAGARGILIGVALGSITTGLRVLIGSDRPYGG